MGGHPEADPTFSSVSTQWPSKEEIAAAGRIRKAVEDSIARLKDPARDVVGELRIVRFLRARHHKEAEATQWYAEFLKTRLEQCPEIESTLRPAVIGLSPSEFTAWYQERIHPSLMMSPWVGFAPSGHGVFIGRPGMMDPVTFTEVRDNIPLSQDRLLLTASLEWTLWYLDEESHRQHKMVYLIKIMDMHGLGSDGRKAPIFVPKMKEFLMGLLQTMQKQYCEHDALFVVVNASLMFRMVFGVISAILTSRQRSKVRILGNPVDASVRAKLLDIVPASLLPKEIGGELPSLEPLYPAPKPDAIPAWIARVRAVDMWAPRQGPSATDGPPIAGELAPTDASLAANTAASAHPEAASPQHNPMLPSTASATVPAQSIPAQPETVVEDTPMLVAEVIPVVQAKPLQCRFC